MPRSSGRDEPEYEWVGFNATGGDWTFESGAASPATPVGPGQAIFPDLFNTSIHQIADYTNFIRIMCTVFVNPVNTVTGDEDIQSVLVAKYIDNVDRYSPGSYWTDPDELGTDEIVGYTANSLKVPAESTIVDDEPSAKLHLDVSSTRVIEDSGAVLLEYENVGGRTVALNAVGRVLMRKD